MKHVRALRATLWCALLAQTTPTPSLHSPEKSSVRLVHHQNLAYGGLFCTYGGLLGAYLGLFRELMGLCLGSGRQGVLVSLIQIYCATNSRPLAT